MHSYSSSPNMSDSTSIVSVAHAAQQGKFRSLDDFRRAIQAAAMPWLQEQEPSMVNTNPFRYSGAALFLCVVKRKHSNHSQWSSQAMVDVLEASDIISITWTD
jgi:hypothetical protein